MAITSELETMPTPIWYPEPSVVATSHIMALMQYSGTNDYQALHRWSVMNYTDFWAAVVATLPIQFEHPYRTIVDLSAGIEFPKWFPEAKLNIVNSCLHTGQSGIAIIEQSEAGVCRKLTYAELDKLSSRIAYSLSQRLEKGSRVAIIMPMTIEAVALYLGVIKAGYCNVAIAESFSVDEIAARLRIADVKMVFTQNELLRDGKWFPLYEKIVQAQAPATVVLPVTAVDDLLHRAGDEFWQNFLSAEENFSAVASDPETYTTILFSSGTTGEPKAIPWTQVTPIKCASDAYFHLDLKPEDVLCWPTSLGWMMGPWTIFAAFINRCTLALYNGSPTGRPFGEFVTQTGVTILGVVPTLVRMWRNTKCMEGLDWHAIKLFCSTGECSNIDDMNYLMTFSGSKPVIEYCGGTEIGGAYVTSTIVQPNAPTVFTTPTLGLDFVILDEDGQVANTGEVALLPPSIGLSTELLNKDHHQVYYANMPKLSDEQILRRHGDQIQRYENGCYRLQGRIDDTMNLGGIKVSSVEIERVLNGLPMIRESAAIAVTPSGGGPSQLVIYVVLQVNKSIATTDLIRELQQAIKIHLNPLFKIHDVVIVDILPRTASNKLMRRVLRDNYASSHFSTAHRSL